MRQLISTLKEAAKYPFLKIPYVQKVYNAYTSCPWYPGHFYSTIPSLPEVEKNKQRIFGDHSVKDINLNVEAQFQLVQSFKPYYDEMPFIFDDTKKHSLRYKSKNAMYRFSDVIFLHAFIRHYRPKKIIEVGSGHSSAVMLDTNEHFFNKAMRLTFIEPYPGERLLKVLRPEDRLCSSIYERFVQNIDITFFHTLDANDILFIDSSHVSKVGSDVNYLIFEVFPELKPGVLIHVHDIFYPFELPQEWILRYKCFWNEVYLLRAFLMNNHDYEILMFNSLLQKQNKDWFNENMPLCLEGSDFTGSIWLRKIR